MIASGKFLELATIARVVAEPVVAVGVAPGVSPPHAVNKVANNDVATNAPSRFFI
jgi:hypothetical protein